MIRIQLTNVTKQFELSSGFLSQIKQKKSTTEKNNVKLFTALNNINLTINSGEVVGLVGVNGSGKSTLSNMISEIITPTSGSCEVNGDVAIIAVSQGLKKVLTGRENIMLKCLMLGMTEKQIKEKMPHIIEFADIGDFIDQPIKKYSSGMKSRLGFAIAVNVDADILIVDEALSVGDKTFYQKCIDRMNEFKDEGKTIIFVSHSLNQIKSFCSRVIWLEYGKIREDGESDEVLKHYKKFLDEYKNMSAPQKKEFRQKQLSNQKMPVIENEQHNRELSVKSLAANILTFSILISLVLYSGLEVSQLSGNGIQSLIDVIKNGL
ncbi:ABC transporter ATP-binding protein [Exiguobacterium sp. SH3S2]|uniref:ABC transporter ATP-binding protein n=1 Tax=unclassified Exiguobacterium TaxID=2644629 RepID=UPI001038EE03|nr:MULTISPECIES: ABC transporter ATP-binding protein [unclassified Exiguobacterium]TCI46135.1 ABC transporter ATP-binding protein [Exiguobacterium sp. SH3S3]TCI61223.1 ABC transporter ATP-binding protein [Exiguobacterium sp. SH3S2]